MTGFTALLVHSADIYVMTEVNTGGRITETWTKQGAIPCRFSSPATTRVSPVAGASIESVDATIFTGPELLTAISTSKAPVRVVTTDAGWSGTYEIRETPRVICAGHSAVHHCECDAKVVQTA